MLIITFDNEKYLMNFNFNDKWVVKNLKLYVKKAITLLYDPSVRNLEQSYQTERRWESKFD